MSTRSLYQKGSVEQGADESISYAFTMTNWGTVAASPAPTCTLKNLTTNTTCTSTKLSGSASLNTTTNTITTPKVVSLEAGMQYRLTVVFTINSNLLSGFLDITAE